MPIIFPNNLRNITAGALKQIKQQGVTTASKGYVGLDFAANKIADFRMADYLYKHEPLGILMTTTNETVKDINAVADAISLATRAMVDAAKESNKQMTDVSGKMRDNAEKLGTAIQKFSKIANDSNFANTAKVAESLVDSLERLAELERTGVLDRVMKAMAKQGSLHG